MERQTILRIFKSKRGYQVRWTWPSLRFVALEDRICGSQMWFGKEWTALPRPASQVEVKWSCSVVSDSVTLWTVAYQAPLSMGFFQASLLEWVAISFSRGYSWPRDRTQVFCTAGRLLTIEAGGFPGWEIGTKIATTGSTMPDSLQRAVRTILCFQAGVTNLFL